MWNGGIGLTGIAEGLCHGMHMRLGLLHVIQPDVPRLVRHAGLEYIPSYFGLLAACSKVSKDKRPITTISQALPSLCRFSRAIQWALGPRQSLP